MKLKKSGPQKSRRSKLNACSGPGMGSVNLENSVGIITFRRTKKAIPVYRITETTGGGISDNRSEASPHPRKNKNEKGAKVRAKIRNFRPTLEEMRSVFDWQSDSPNEQHLNGHPVVGDLNPTGWADDYQRWLADAGAWELSNPESPTHKKGIKARLGRTRG